MFIEALRTTEQMDIACRRFAARVPLLANMVEGGLTPMHSAAELGARGFRIVIFPGGTVRAVAAALQAHFASLAANLTTAPWCDRMLDFDALNRVIGTPQLLAAGRAYAEDAAAAAGATGLQDGADLHDPSPGVNRP